MASRPRVDILSFSPIASDARVLRQVEYLSRSYAVRVIGYGEYAPPPEWGAEMALVSLAGDIGWRRKLRTLALLPLGRLAGGPAYESWYWGRANHRSAYKILKDSDAGILHANDWNALPVALRAAAQTGGKVVLDLHEYAPRQSEEFWHWRVFQRPMIEHFLRRYSRRAAATITVNETIAEEYARQYGFHPVVVMNAPRLAAPTEFRPTDPAAIHLIHHGAAMRDRKLEGMIQAFAAAQERFILNFMLLESNAAYVDELRTLGERLAPGRVFFHPPVKPDETVERIASFDLGFYILHPTNFNNAAALPNKFFDFIAAGLGVVIGPSPEMARLSRQYGFGAVAASFRPEDAAVTLNRLSAEDIDRMKQAARQARLELNADVEMGKLVQLYAELSSQEEPARAGQR